MAAASLPTNYEGDDLFFCDDDNAGGGDVVDDSLLLLSDDNNSTGNVLEPKSFSHPGGSLSSDSSNFSSTGEPTIVSSPSTTMSNAYPLDSDAEDNNIIMDDDEEVYEFF